MFPVRWHGGELRVAHAASADSVKQVNLSNLELKGKELRGLHSEISSNLLHLNLAFNRLQSLNDVIPFTAIQYLNLMHNRLDSLEGISQLKSLHVFQCSNNRITSLSDLSKSKMLETLVLDRNKVANFSQLVSLKKLQGLRNLVLTRNPCCSQADNAVLQILHDLPLLDCINGISVTQTIRDQAKCLVNNNETREEFIGANSHNIASEQHPLQPTTHNPTPVQIGKATSSNIWQEEKTESESIKQQNDPTRRSSASRFKQRRRAKPKTRGARSRLTSTKLPQLDPLANIQSAVHVLSQNRMLVNPITERRRNGLNPIHANRGARTADGVLGHKPSKHSHVRKRQCRTRGALRPMQSESDVWNEHDHIGNEKIEAVEKKLNEELSFSQEGGRRDREVEMKYCEDVVNNNNEDSSNSEPHNENNSDGLSSMQGLLASLMKKGANAAALAQNQIDESKIEDMNINSLQLRTNQDNSDNLNSMQGLLASLKAKTAHADALAQGSGIKFTDRLATEQQNNSIGTDHAKIIQFDDNEQIPCILQAVKTPINNKNECNRQYEQGKWGDELLTRDEETKNDGHSVEVDGQQKQQQELRKIMESHINASRRQRKLGPRGGELTREPHRNVQSSNGVLGMSSTKRESDVTCHMSHPMHEPRSPISTGNRTLSISSTKRNNQDEESKDNASNRPAPHQGNHITGFELNYNRGGGIAVALYPDGSAQARWPSSTLAVSITQSASGWRTLACLPRGNVAVSFDENMAGCVNYENGRSFLTVTAHGKGMVQHANGDLSETFDSNVDVNKLFQVKIGTHIGVKYTLSEHPGRRPEVDIYFKSQNAWFMFRHGRNVPPTVSQSEGSLSHGLPLGSDVNVWGKRKPKRRKNEKQLSMEEMRAREGFGPAKHDTRLENVQASVHRDHSNGNGFVERAQGQGQASISQSGVGGFQRRWT